MSRLESREKLARARERATVARMRFLTSLQSTQQRLSFGRLKSDALVVANDKVQDVRNDLKQSLRRHPVVATSALLGLVGVIFWKPARIAALYGLRGAQLFWLNRNLWRRVDDD